MTSLEVTKIIDSGWNMYMVTDPGGLPAAPVAITAPLNGLAGLMAASYVTVTTGTQYGPIHITVAIHDDAPEPELAEWTDVVELPFAVVSGHISFADWGGEAFYITDLPPGPWRLRVHARGRDDGAARTWGPFDPEEGPEEQPAEEHLLQLFPGGGGEIVYKTEDAFGGRGRGAPAPAPAPAVPPPPPPPIDEVMRQVIENLPRASERRLDTGSPTDTEVTNLHIPFSEVPDP